MAKTCETCGKLIMFEDDLICLDMNDLNFKDECPDWSEDTTM
jgi:hypothetical protein